MWGLRRGCLDEEDEEGISKEEDEDEGIGGYDEEEWG